MKVQIDAIESGTYSVREMIVVFVAMKDNEWLPAASFAVGDRLRLTVIPFTEASPQIRGMQRADDTDDFALRPYFVVRADRR